MDTTTSIRAARGHQQALTFIEQALTFIEQGLTFIEQGRPGIMIR